MIYGLTSLGVVHTAISLVAVAAGLIALVRDKRISPDNRLGRVYLITTVLTCLTGFGIFQHGGFGKPHALGIITLVVLAFAEIARRGRLFGGWAGDVVMVSYSITFFFHLVPGITETTTRLPLGAPLLPGPDAPELQMAAGVLFVLLVVGAIWQVRHFRAAARLAPA